MDKLNQLYNLVFSPIITPANLLENIKLPNYKYVHYEIENNYLTIKMKCILENENEAIFIYYFDMKDNLQIVKMVSDGEDEILFDRKDEIVKLQDRILQEKKNKIENNVAV